MRYLTKEQIEYYFKGDKIQCLICEKWFKALGPHLLTHGYNVDKYKEMFGLPWSRGLVGCKTADKFRDNAETLRVEGKLLTGIVSEGHRVKVHKKGPRRITPSHSNDRSKYLSRLGRQGAKYTSLDYDECWSLFRSGFTQEEIGKKFNVSQMCISRFMRKENKWQR